MNAKDLKFKRYLGDIGFFFDKENNYWYHYGDIFITGKFNIPVNIFVEGDLTITGYCIVNELNVTGILNVHEYLSCDNLSASYVHVREDLICKNASVYCDLTVENNVDAKDVTVYGDFYVGGTLDAHNVKAAKFYLKHATNCYSIASI